MLNRAIESETESIIHYNLRSQYAQEQITRLQALIVHADSMTNYHINNRRYYCLHLSQLEVILNRYESPNRNGSSDSSIVSLESTIDCNSPSYSPSMDSPVYSPSFNS